MIHEVKNYISIEESDKKTIKRKLARNLIQQIIQLYGTIIEKIEHGIGLLWEEYISEELYSIAKKKVENDLINDLQELEDWFENIADNIKDKFNILSESLMSHFNHIIQSELESLHRHMESPLGLTLSEQLEKKIERDSESNDENKESLSLYETCTESSKEDQNGINRPKKLCLACEDHLNEAFGYCTKHQYLEKPIFINENNYSPANKLEQSKYVQEKEFKPEFSSSEKRSYESQKRRKRRIESEEIDEKEDEEGSFYEVFFGLLEAFEI